MSAPSHGQHHPNGRTREDGLGCEFARFIQRRSEGWPGRGAASPRWAGTPASTLHWVRPLPWLINLLRGGCGSIIGAVSRLTRAGLWGIAFILGAGAGFFLVSQGLGRASLWATVVGLPVAVAGTAAGAWSALLTARALREAREGTAHSGRQDRAPSSETPSRKEADVELVDATIDPKIGAIFMGTLPPEDQPADDCLISDVEFRHEAIDFKFINHGDVTAILHQFTVEILDFQLDVSPVLTYSVELLVGEGGQFNSRTYRNVYKSLESLVLEVNNHGWGDAVDFSAYLSDPTIRRLFPDPKLFFHSEAVSSGESATFTLLAADADRARLQELITQRKKVLTRVATARKSMDLTMFKDPKFKQLPTDERRLIERFWDTYRDERDLNDALKNAFLPIKLDLNVDYIDQKNKKHSLQEHPYLCPVERGQQKRILSPPFASVGELGIDHRGFRYDLYTSSGMFSFLHPSEVYSVLLDPRASHEYSYSISRAVPPTGADRFHVLVAARQSGVFTLRLTFHVNKTGLVRSDPILVSLKHPRNARLPIHLVDGASFKLGHGQLELGGPFFGSLA